MQSMIEEGARAMSARNVPLLFEDRCHESQAVLLRAFRTFSYEEVPESAITAMRQRLHHLGLSTESGEVSDYDIAFVFLAGIGAMATELQTPRRRALAQ